MKKLTLVPILLTLLLVLPQMGLSQQYRFGLFANPKLSWINSDTKRLDPNGSIMGFNVGFSGEKFFSRRYAFASGLSLNNVGGNLRFTDNTFTLKTKDGTYPVSANTTVKFKAQYITLPLGFKFRTNQIGYATFYGSIGVAGSVRLKGFVWYDEADVNRESSTEHLMWGFASYYIGAGLEYSLGGESAIQLGITFSDGLTPLLDLPDATLTSQSLALNIGIVF